MVNGQLEHVDDKTVN